MPIHLHGSIRRQKKRDKIRKSHLLIVTYVIQKTTLASTLVSLTKNFKS